MGTRRDIHRELIAAWFDAVAPGDPAIHRGRKTIGPASAAAPKAGTEAQAQAGGRRRGKMGSRIGTEMFRGLLEGGANSFVSRKPGWTLAEDGLPARGPGDFTMPDLLRRVGEINPIGG